MLCKSVIYPKRLQGSLYHSNSDRSHRRDVEHHEPHLIDFYNTENLNSESIHKLGSSIFLPKLNHHYHLNLSTLADFPFLSLLKSCFVYIPTLAWILSIILERFWLIFAFMASLVMNEENLLKNSLTEDDPVFI